MNEQEQTDTEKTEQADYRRKFVESMSSMYADRRFPDQLNLPKPGGNDTLWRYLDFTQYISLIHKGELHFSRPDCFDDRFEGSLPKKNVEKRRRWAENVDIEERLLGSSIIESDDKEKIREILENINKEDMINDTFENVNEVMLSKVGVSCWHNEPAEKAAMWNLYSQSGHGIAIKSTYTDLIEPIEQFDPERPELTESGELKSCLVGEVTYVDYKTGEIPDTIVHPLFYKRDSFSHENEVRVVQFDFDGINQDGVYLNTDIPDLVGEIRLEPGSPEWFEKLVISVTDGLEQDINIERSELEKDPMY